MRLLPVLLAVLAAAPAVAPEKAFSHRALRFEGAEVHVLTLSRGATVVPVAGRPGRTVFGWAQKAGAIAAVNGGYFNHSDGRAVSAVVANGTALTHPRRNRALVENPALAPLLPKIFDRRVEWRLLHGALGEAWAIAPHAAAPPEGMALVHALQAGPMLLPRPRLEEEGFVSPGRDGIASAVPAARSALGLTHDGAMLWVAASGSGRGRTGLTIAQLSRLMAELGCERAMALDGGSSTTLSWQEGGRWHTFTGSGQGPARVNSALVLTP